MLFLCQPKLSLTLCERVVKFEAPNYTIWGATKIVLLKSLHLIWYYCEVM